MAKPVPKQFGHFLNKRSSLVESDQLLKPSPCTTPQTSPICSPCTTRSALSPALRGTVSDPLSMEDIESLSQSSTISVDSTTCSNLASKTEFNIPITAQQLLERSREVLAQQLDVEAAIIENNRALKMAIDSMRSHRQKTSEVQDSNTQLRRRVSVLEKEKKEIQISKEELEKNDKEKGGCSARLKIDQAAAAVKSLKEQLADKDRQLQTMQSKIDHVLRTGTAETSTLINKVRDYENKITMLEEERNTLKLAVQVQESTYSESDTGEYLRQEAELHDCKNQVALLTCQDAVVRRLLDSLEELLENGSTPNSSIQKKISFLSAFMDTPPNIADQHYVDRPEHYVPPQDHHYVDRTYAASLAASHTEQGGPPSSSYCDVDYRPY